MRWTDTTAGNHHVIVTAHSTNSFDNLSLIIGNDFDPLESNTQGEAVFRKEGGIGIYGLWVCSAFSIRDGCYAVRYADLSTQDFIAYDEAPSRVNHALAPLVGHGSCSERSGGRVVQEVRRLASNVAGKLIESREHGWLNRFAVVKSQGAIL